MYVHLGGEVVVAVREVIAVLDGRSVATSAINQDLIARAPRLGDPAGTVPAPASRGAASWVVTTGGVHPSGMSAATLARRMTHFEEHGDS